MVKNEPVKTVQRHEKREYHRGAAVAPDSSHKPLDQQQQDQHRQGGERFHQLRGIPVKARRIKMQMHGPPWRRGVMLSNAGAAAFHKTADTADAEHRGGGNGGGLREIFDADPAFFQPPDPNKSSGEPPPEESPRSVILRERPPLR